MRPVTPLVDILPGLTGMLNDPVSDADRIAKDYAGIIILGSWLTRFPRGSRHVRKMMCIFMTRAETGQVSPRSRVRSSAQAVR